MPPLIHIGYHKTATSWFQSQFYPFVKNGSFVPRALTRSALIEPSAFDFSPECAREQLGLAIPTSERLLLCEENLSGYIHNGGLGGILSFEIARRIQATFPDAQIIVFIRSQERLAAAAYAQYVRAGGTHSIGRYLGLNGSKGATKYWYKAPAFSLDHLTFAPLLRHYSRLFDRSAVHVYCYEEFANDAPSFARSFADFHGLTIDIDQLSFAPVNRSLSPGELRVLRYLNLFTDRSVPNKRSIADLQNWYHRRLGALGLLHRSFGKFLNDKPVMSDVLANIIRGRFEETNRALASQWRLPLRHYGYP